jgi:MoaA/NifB/PqqE/SkfB family radical SAM enzyme
MTIELDQPTMSSKAREARIRFDYLKKLFSTENRSQLLDYFNDTLKGPLLVEFDPTTACNFSCPECISGDLLNQSKIPSERIDALISEFARAGVRGIIFVGGGEPLAHKCMPGPIVKAHEVGIQVGLTTNGSLISRYMDALANCVAWTRVSIDAGSHKTFAIFRPNKLANPFGSILRQMEELAKRKTGALGFSFLIIQRGTGGERITNAHEIFRAAQIAKEIGCDYFEYKPMVDNRHYLVPFDAAMRELISEQSALCASLVDDTFDVIAPRSIAYLGEREDPIQPKAYERCPAMELRTLVTPSGIYPCPYMRGRADKLLGTVDDGPFDEFWNSPKRRLAALKTNPAIDCEFYCIRHNTNLALDALKTLRQQGVDLLPHVASASVDDVFF